MSAFKKLDRKDVFTTSYLASKAFTDSADTPTYSIDFLLGTSGSTQIFKDDELYNQRLRYKSIKQLYYSNYIDDKDIITGSFENYLQSSLFTSSSRNLLNKATIVSYPRGVIGEGIKPNTVIYTIAGLGEYILDQGDYVLETALAGGKYIEAISGSEDGVIKDDGEGRLKVDSGNPFSVAEDTVVGNVFYGHGLAIITEEDLVDYFASPFALNFNWQSLQSIFTMNINCKVKDEELNFSLNPTSLKDNNGNISDNVSGSQFSPYITTIGLYNDFNELIAVAKLGQPIPKSTDTDMTFQIKLDV